MGITAKEAKVLTEEALSKIDEMDNIRPLIEIIDMKITVAAAQGLRQVVNPFFNLETSSRKRVFTSSQQDALLKKYYKDQGFEYGDSPATDPGDPRGDGSYTYLRW